MLYGRLPTADHIARDWAPMVEARTDLHELVLRLLAQTPGVTRLNVRTGEGTGAAGWDGEVEARGSHPWVPAGPSYWELGTGADPRDKAQSDYKKRTDATDSGSRRVSTFVFVTPRRWTDGTGKEGWVRRKLGEGDWADVRAIDADDLAGWLITCPPAHIWLAERISGPVPGVHTLRQWWQEWAYNPPGAGITPELAIAGRTREADMIRAWVSDAPAYHPVRSSSTVGEVIALVAAALGVSDPGASAVDRALVVRDMETWRRLIVSESMSMILIPMFQGPDSQGAIDRGHVVIEPLPSGRVGQWELDLPARPAGELQTVLEASGVPTDRAHQLAREARYDLEVVRRRFASGGPRPPTWAAGDATRYMVPALLAGGWDQGMRVDTQVLSLLAGIEYDDLERELGTIAGSAETPLKRRGDIWVLGSPVDAWRQLHARVTSAQWDAFSRFSTQVLGAADPAWELPAEERWLASVRGVRRDHSSVLREGLARTLAIIASLEEFTNLPGGRSGAGIAARVVQDVLAPAKEDPTGGGWAALADVLPLLAEAAPDQFLESLHASLSSSEQSVRPLFEEQPSPLFSTANHPPILWSLQRLAWSPAHLIDVSVALARLAAVDPGGNTHPRPASTLQTIFLLDRPQTAANHEQRLAALEAIWRRGGDSAWMLLRGLIPTPGAVLSTIVRPEYRPWIPEQPEAIRYEHMLEMVERIVGWLVEGAGVDAQRWGSLVEAIPDLTTELSEPILEGLARLDPDAFDLDGLEVLATIIRGLIGSHTAFRDASWAMDEARVERLRELAPRFDPPDPVVRDRWLFENWPKVERIPGEDYDQREGRVDDERRAALVRIEREKGWDGIEELVDIAESPYQVGRIVATVPGLPETSVLGWALWPDESRRAALDGYTWARSTTDGWTWVETAVTNHSDDWDPEVQARVLLAARETRRAWELAHTLGPDVERAYWWHFRRHVPDDELWEAVEKLVAHGQAFVAIDIAASARHRKDVAPRVDLIAAALDAATRGSAPEQVRSDVAYDIAELFTILDEAGHDDEQLAALEWRYLAVLDRSDYTPRHVVKRLVTDPEFFVELVSLVYRADSEARSDDGEEPLEPSEQAIRMAQNGYRLLSVANRAPGVSDTGVMTVDELKRWTWAVREMLAATDRVTVGDRRIGHLLWYAPPGTDGVHPHEAVRDLIEELASEDLEAGFATEAFNSVGVRVRRADGGGEEREIAQSYDELAATLTAWPRTSRVLRRLGGDYRALARHEDVEAQLREDRWS